MAASRMKASKERRHDLYAEVKKAAAAAAAAQSELLGYENDSGSLLRQHQQRLQQLKNEIGVHRRQQDKLRVIESQEEEEVKALQQSNRVSEMQIMSFMKEKDAALARIADDKRAAAAARLERDSAVAKQQAVAAELAALQAKRAFMSCVCLCVLARLACFSAASSLRSILFVLCSIFRAKSIAFCGKLQKPRLVATRWPKASKTRSRCKLFGGKNSNKQNTILR
jgi:hypothetical protein